MDALEPGLHGAHEFDVDGPLLTDVGGSLGTTVLAIGVGTHQRRVVDVT